MPDRDPEQAGSLVSSTHYVDLRGGGRRAATDPLNLTRVVTPGPRVPATLGQVVRYVDGVPEPQGPAAESVESLPS